MIGVRLGILGGTFDPIHNGHIAAAHAAASALGLDRVLLVPAGRPWHRGTAPIASAQQRLDMTRIAVEGDPLLRASSLDVDRDGDTFAVDLLRDVRAAFPQAELVLILGADAYAHFDSWREPEVIRALAQLAVVTRNEASSAFPANPDATASPAAGSGVTAVDLSGYDISATDIRRRCTDGEPIAHLVPPGVADYIAAQGLYR
mgnify:CR=1 FL=1